MKKLPLGIQTFSKLREENCVYVDKTKHIYQLLQGYCYFFARPRRFGKSILCSTLASLFQGKKELFEDLWITKNTDYTFPVHPVIHIDFGNITVKTPELFTQELVDCLYAIAQKDASKALEQIKTKKYFEQYQQDSRPITLIGIMFSAQEKNIANFKIEELKK